MDNKDRVIHIINLLERKNMQIFALLFFAFLMIFTRSVAASSLLNQNLLTGHLATNQCEMLGVKVLECDLLSFSQAEIEVTIQYDFSPNPYLTTIGILSLDNKNLVSLSSGLHQSVTLNGRGPFRLVDTNPKRTKFIRLPKDAFLRITNIHKEISSWQKDTWRKEIFDLEKQRDEAVLARNAYAKLASLQPGFNLLHRLWELRGEQLRSVRNRIREGDFSPADLLVIRDHPGEEVSFQERYIADAFYTLLQDVEHFSEDASLSESHYDLFNRFNRNRLEMLNEAVSKLQYFEEKIAELTNSITHLNNNLGL